MIWYPYQQMKTITPPLKVIDAEGARVTVETPGGETRVLVDAISSWWCMIHGYKNPEITEAIKNQADKFSHVMLGGLTHDPVLQLSEKLENWLPGDLNYCFFSDSGSVAVEVALKMALQYYVNQGEMNRTKILSLTESYHGDTFMAMEAGDDEDYHQILKAYGSQSKAIHVDPDIDKLNAIFEEHHKELNCFIVEPVIQGAAGVKMYDIELLRRARELCDRYGVLLIFDEVATGFGRTGYRFVADEVLPDIIVLGKALTGGHIGHAATVANTRVYEAFLSDDPDKALMHGPTFMGNPLACAAALKSIEIFERDNYMAKIRHITEIMNEEMDGFSHPLVKEVRILGGACCIEVVDDEALNGFKPFALECGVFARPFLSFLYTMPAYIISDDELRQILRCFRSWFEGNHYQHN